MAKSKAKKAKTLLRAAAKAVRPIGPLTKFQQMKLQLMNQLPAGFGGGANPKARAKKARKRAKKNAGSGSPWAMVPVSDGINKSMVMQNSSTIEDTFQIRMEKVVDIIGSTSAFSLIQSYYLNPGNTVLFPIFSQIAATYEQYRINRLRFHFVTQAYTASGSAVGSGRLIMTTSFDPDDANFTTKNQMENYEGSDPFPPFTPHVIHDVIEKRKKRKIGGTSDLPLNNYFVYSSANSETPVTGAGKFYDPGNFQFAACATVDGTSTLGELYVEYGFTMIRPKQQVPLGQNIIAAKYAFTPVSTTSHFGTPVQRSQSTLALTFTANAFTIPVNGTFLCLFVGYGATSWTDASTISAGTGGSLLQVWNADTVTGFGAGSGGTTWAAGQWVNVTGGSCVVTYSASPTIVGAATADMVVVQVPSGIVTLAMKEQKTEDRVAILENQLRKLLADKNGWDTEESKDDWHCRNTNTETWGPAKATSSGVVKVDEPIDLCGKCFKNWSNCTCGKSKLDTKLSDSVVDLITSKLRK